MLVVEYSLRLTQSGRARAVHGAVGSVDGSLAREQHSWLPVVISNRFGDSLERLHVRVVVDVAVRAVEQRVAVEVGPTKFCMFYSTVSLTKKSILYM